MKSIEIKNTLRRLTGLAVAVRTIPSANPNRWVEARVRPTITGGALVYPASFDGLTMRAAIAVVYGAEYARLRPAGGNIGAHSICLFESQWAELFSTLEAIKSCSPSTPESALQCLFMYLENKNLTAV